MNAIHCLIYAVKTDDRDSSTATTTIMILSTMMISAYSSRLLMLTLVYLKLGVTCQQCTRHVTRIRISTC